MTGLFRRPITVHNSGSIPGGRYFNQCMFISIRDYLNRNGYPDLTLEELRYQAGLAGIMETQEWDQDIEIHVRALRNLSEIYSLDINIWDVGPNGLLDPRYLTDDNTMLIPRYREGEGRVNVVNIASYGRHFELIIRGSIFSQNEIRPDDVISDKIGEYIPHIPKGNQYIKFDSLLGLDKLKEESKNEISTLKKLKLIIIDDITYDEEQKVLNKKNRYLK